MTYQHIEYDKLRGTDLFQTFHHADMILHDVYGMMRVLPPADGDGGGGNFVAALALLCVIDGLRKCNVEHKGQFGALAAVGTYDPQPCQYCPKNKPGKSSTGEPFIKFINEHLRLKSVTLPARCCVARHLFFTFRSPLVHALAIDELSPSAAKGKPVIGRWGPIPESYRSIEKIDQLASGTPRWPVLSEEKNSKSGTVHLKLSLAALYWSVKDLAHRMLAVLP